MQLWHEFRNTDKAWEYVILLHFLNLLRGR